MKIKRLSIILIHLSLPFLLFTGCLKDGDDTLVLPTPDGKIPYSVIPERLQDSLRDNGFVIHEGITPPSIEGKFKVSPMDLQYASDDYQNNFYDLIMTLSGQYPRGRVSYSESQVDTVLGLSTMANVIGKGDDFTMYCFQNIAKTNRDGDTLYTCSTATVVSGTIAKEGIHNCQYTNIILDKWAVNDYYASQIPPVETYRIWNDGNGLASRLGSTQTTKL